MPAYFQADKYQKYLLRMQGGKQYLQVIGALKAAIDYGVILGTETTVTETPDVVRVHVRVKAFNKHLDNFDSLPVEAQIGYYDGIADNPKVGGSGAARQFPLEDAETSALGRALSKMGFNFETMATADEMQIVGVKQGSGYSAPEPSLSEKLTLALKASGVTTKAAANKEAKERYEKMFAELTDAQMQAWLDEVSSNNEQMKKPTPF